MIVHLVSREKKKAACGTYYPSLENDLRRTTGDVALVTCGRCNRAVNAAAKDGRMLFEEN